MYIHEHTLSICNVLMNEGQATRSNFERNYALEVN